MAELFLGIDSSTQGTKVICLDLSDRSITYLDYLNYDRELPQYGTRNGVIPSDQPGLSEADPRMWIDALKILFQRMKTSGFPMREIKAISVSGQQHGLVTLDAEGNLTRSRSKLWNDYSTVEECKLLTESVGGKQKMIEEIGNSQRPGYTAGKIFHLYRHEPETARKTTTFFLVHNYINWFLTGGIRIMEPGDVSGMALRHPGSTEWSEKVCHSISPDLISKLPPVKPSDEMIGTICPSLVESFGFSPECQIAPGSGDNMHGAIGTGNIEPGIVTVSLGTSGTAYTIFNEPYVDTEGEIASFCDSTGKFLALLCVSNMANGYNQILDLYKLNHEEFNQILQQTPAGNRGRILIPWYSGERTPDLPLASPIYFAFRLEDFNREVLCRAVLEGHVLNLYDGYIRMPITPREIRLTGGLSKSEAWCQTIADVFGVQTVPVEGEGAALGAALHAAWVYSKTKGSPHSLKELTNAFVRLDESRRKIPQHQDIYGPLRSAYHELSRRLRHKMGKVDLFEWANRMRGDVSGDLSRN
ncbi:MAG: xylulokinase [Calditrichia bacterium]